MENFHFLVLDALTKASSQNSELIKLAEQQLKCLEAEKGFYTTLMMIVSDRTIDVNIRWLAAVCLKNGVDRYWRKSAPKPSGFESRKTFEYPVDLLAQYLRSWSLDSTTINNRLLPQGFDQKQEVQERVPSSISNEEKAVLKQKFLTCFDEPVNQIAAQIALIIAKAARMDCPREWPELLPTLLNVIQLPDDLSQQRGLLVMHHVVKALSTKRLVADRKVFQQLTAGLFNNVLHLWIGYSSSFLQEIKNSMTNHRLLLEKCLFCLKILRKLVVYGFKDPSKEPDAVNLFSCIFQQLRPFIDCRKSIEGQDILLETCEKYLNLLVKVLRDVLEQHPFAFIQFIRPTLECAVTFCFTKEYRDVMYERLNVYLLNLIKAIVLCQEYKPAKHIEDTKNPLTLEAHKLKCEFFTFPVLSEIVDQLLTRYFILSDNDLKNWEENPEEFASDESGESWKFSLRPSTEVLFLALFREFSNTLIPLVVEAMTQAQNSKATDFASILKKEAVYNAIGLAAFELYDEIDFDHWFTELLIPELRIKDNNYIIIRRRVIWLIGQWVGVKLSPELRPTIYQLILQILKTEEDLVVRLAAANSLKIAVDDFEFNVEQFLPYLEQSITTLFFLLKEVRECDLKMSVLHVLSFVIERVRWQVRPYAHSLMQYLPQLWDSCGEHNLLRCAIISCFVHLVQGLGNLSENLHPFLLPMIAFSTDVTLPPHVYLLEDGLDLWWAVIDNTSTCNQQFLDIARYLLPLLEYGSENLKKCLEITDAYIILSPKAFFERYGDSIVKTFLYILTDMVSWGIVSVMKVVETALIVFPIEGPVFFKPVLSKALTLVLENKELPTALSVYLSLLARVILHNQNCFGSILQEKASEVNLEGEEVLSNLLDVWLEKMSLVNVSERRKLLGLALACLLTSGSNVVHNQICGVLLAVVEVLNDITRLDNTTDFNFSSLVINSDEIPYRDEDEGGEETEHDKRKRELTRLDPVYTVALKDYLHSQMTTLEQSVGTTKFQDLMSTVDVETMQQLKGYLRRI